MTRPCLVAALLLLSLLVAGCTAPAAAPTPVPTVVLPAVSPSPTVPPTTPLSESGTITFMLDPKSTQAMTLVVTDAASNVLLEGIVEQGKPLEGSLPPGEFLYRATQIFEPLEPTACYQSVDEGALTISTNIAPQTVMLFNGVIEGCTSP